MNYIIKSILVTMAMAAPAVSGAADKSVVVISKDGTQKELILPEVDRMEINTGGIVLLGKNGSRTETSYDDLDRVLIGADRSAIASITSPGEIAVWPTRTASDVNVSGANPETAITIHDMGGALRIRTVASADGTASIDLSQLQAGIYILHVDNHSVKLIKE